MNTLNRLDAFVLGRGHIVAGAPVTFGWSGKDYTGTSGDRETADEAVPGGIVNGQEFTILVATAAFGEDARPGERKVVSVCVDGDGIPCGADDAVGERVASRIVSIDRAGGGLLFTLRSAQRG